jgi:hypothetical protein
MAQKKKLQVFVSSTYTDLREERQAAVEAILTSGHIPAGMELFAAGDESQMNVIKRWIDESDVYMLILGGRYGTIDSKSQKSYIHLEYEYALDQGNPLFAVVIDEKYLEKKVKKYGVAVIEKDHPDKLKQFRELVCSKMVRFWSDPKDIKLAVMETMADFERREDLIGWIPGNESINTGIVAEEIAQLTKENKELRIELNRLSSDSIRYSGLLFDEMYSLLAATKVNSKRLSQEFIDLAEETARILEDAEPKLLHYFLVISKLLHRGTKENNDVTTKLEELGLVEWISSGNNEVSLDIMESYHQEPTTYIVLSESGRQFVLRLKLNGIISRVEPCIIDHIRFDLGF